MKHRLLLTMLLVLTSIGFSGLKAQKLFLWKQDGTQDPFALSTIKTLTFSSGNLILSSNSGSSDTYSLSALKKITFDNSTSGQNDVLAVTPNLIGMYFNSVENLVYLKSVPKNNSRVLIYRINGVISMQSQVSAGNQSINVSSLASGFYLLKINNQVFKFVK
jgi:hypothetical protein